MRDASAQRCLDQAEQHRKMAEAADDPEVKRKLLQIAKSYDDVAALIERKQSRGEPNRVGTRPREASRFRSE